MCCCMCVVQDGGTAKRLAFSREVNMRCVSLEGDDFNPAGEWRRYRHYSTAWCSIHTHTGIVAPSRDCLHSEHGPEQCPGGRLSRLSNPQAR